jgi:hypothetical protein
MQGNFTFVFPLFAQDPTSFVSHVDIVASRILKKSATKLMIPLILRLGLSHLDIIAATHAI